MEPEAADAAEATAPSADTDQLQHSEQHMGVDAPAGSSSSSDGEAAGGSVEEMMDADEEGSSGGSGVKRSCSSELSDEPAAKRSKSNAADSNDAQPAPDANDAAAAAARKRISSSIHAISLKQYGDRIPSSPDSFAAGLRDWVLSQYRVQLGEAQILGRKLQDCDLHKLFTLVAERGGCEAVNQRRAWGSVAAAWDEAFTASCPRGAVQSMLRSVYSRQLLPYEDHVSSGCPAVVKKYRVTAATAAPAPAATAAVAAAPMPAQQQQLPVESSSGAAAAETPAAQHPVSSSGQVIGPNHRRMLLRFPAHAKHPPVQVVLRAAQQYDQSLTPNNLREKPSKKECVVFFSTTAAAQAAEQAFKQPGFVAQHFPFLQEGVLPTVELGEVQMRAQQQQQPGARGAGRGSSQQGASRGVHAPRGQGAADRDPWRGGTGAGHAAHLTPHEALLAQEAAATAPGVSQAPAAAAAGSNGAAPAPAGDDGQQIGPNHRRLRLRFPYASDGVSMATVLSAAEVYDPSLIDYNVRKKPNREEYLVYFSTTDAALAAQEGFKKPGFITEHFQLPEGAGPAVDLLEVHMPGTQPQQQQQQQGAPGTAAAGGGGDGEPGSNRRRLLLRFPPSSRHPELHALLRAAQQFDPSLIESNIRDRPKKKESVIFFSSTEIAEAAERGFKQPGFAAQHFQLQAGQDVTVELGEVQIRAQQQSQQSQPSQRQRYHQQQQRRHNADGRHDQWSYSQYEYESGSRAGGSSRGWYGQQADDWQEEPHYSQYYYSGAQHTDYSYSYSQGTGHRMPHTAQHLQQQRQPYHPPPPPQQLYHQPAPQVVVVHAPPAPGWQAGQPHALTHPQAAWPTAHHASAAPVVVAAAAAAAAAAPVAVSQQPLSGAWQVPAAQLAAGQANGGSSMGLPASGQQQQQQAAQVAVSAPAQTAAQPGGGINLALLQGAVQLAQQQQQPTQQKQQTSQQQQQASQQDQQQQQQQGASSWMLRPFF